MDDLIKRSDAIKAVSKVDDYGDGIGFEVKRHCLVELELAPSADRPQEWIPCSERLPKRQGHYICTCKDGSKYKRTTVVKWSNGWQLTGTRSYWIVLAWMPLPEPWEGADDDNA